MTDDQREIRQQAEQLLDKAEATPAGPWTINDQDHAAMVNLAEGFSLELPVAAFRFPAAAAQFLRLVLLALRG